MKKIIFAFFISALFFVVSAFNASSTEAAPRLYLDPASETVSPGQDFQVNLKIDVESTQVFGSDALITFPSADITLKSVTKGDFFTDLSFGQTSGMVEIHGYFATSFQTKSGNGTIATLTLSTNKTSGQGVLHFSCDGNGTDTSIIDSMGNNILSCTNLTNSVMTYSQTNNSSQGSDNTNNNSGSNEPNSCNGTCGSHSNCKAGLFCSSGFCRNPDCPGTATCGCSATAKPQGTVKPKVSSTPQVITLAEYTPYPSPVEESEDEVTLEPRQIDLKTLGIITVLTALALILTSWIIKMAKTNKKANSEIVNPPSETPPVTF